MYFMRELVYSGADDILLFEIQAALPPFPLRPMRSQPNFDYTYIGNGVRKKNHKL